MKKYFRKPMFIFCFFLIFLLAVFFLFPVNLFEGEIVYQTGMGTTKIPWNLSLSYFIGMGYEPEQMKDVKDFYLLPRGYALATTFILGIPSIMAYRVYLGNNNRKSRQK